MSLIPVEKFTGFITKYAGELRSIVGVLSTVVSALPFGSTQKTQIADVLSGLGDASDRIEQAAKAIAKAPPVIIKKSDIEAALKPLVDVAVAKALKDAGK